MPETIEAHPINASDKNSGCCKKNDEETATGISRAIILSKQIGRMKFPGLFRSVWIGSGSFATRRRRGYPRSF